MAGTFMLTLLAKGAAKDMTENQARGLNAFRCAITSILQNFQYLLLSVYFFLKQFSQEKLLKDYVFDAYYPNVCTCNTEIARFGQFIMRSQNSDDNSKYIGSCSEKREQMQYA